MPTEKWIFILGATKFDDLFSSTSFSVAKNLASNNHVFYIDYPYTFNDCLRLLKTTAFKTRLKYFFAPFNFIRDTEINRLKIIFCPPLISINFLPEGRLYRFLLKRNEKKIIKRIDRTIKKFGIDQFIYINSFNFHYPDIGPSIKAGLQVYHCVDPIIMPYDKKHGIVSEAKLMACSDVVICTSQKLFEEKIKINPNTFFIPNAADIEHSAKALDDSLSVHNSIAHLKKPVIGYLGTIERRMDYDLLKKVMEANTDKQFVFVGPVATEYVPAWFFNMPNLLLTGKISFSETAHMIKGFDVALIPFKKDEVSDTIFPLKLFEYLGAGKPVVATNFNTNLKEHTYGTVSFCNDAESFSKAIADALIKDDNLLKKRLEVAKKNTWKNRVAELEDLLENSLKQKGK